MFATKIAQSGVLAGYHFDLTSSVRDSSFGADIPMKWAYDAGACSSAGIGSAASLGLTRASGEACAAAIATGGVCYYPRVDNSVYHAAGGGSGSLRIDIPASSGAGTGGYFTLPLKGTLGLGSNFPFIGAPSQSADPNYLGSELWCQFYQRIETEMQDTIFLDEDGVSVSGWKQIIQFGEPPNGTSSSHTEVTLVNSFSRGVPAMYGQSGADGYEPNISGETFNPWFQYTHNGSAYVGICPYNQGYHGACIRYDQYADQWIEFTIRIKVDPTNSGTPNAANSWVDLWVNGIPTIQYRQAKINWGNNDAGSGPTGKGVGQFHLSTYITRKYTSQVHGLTGTWFDDVIFSTESIAFGSDSSSASKLVMAR